MPSTLKACSAMLASAEIEGQGDIVDLGSGWGTLVAYFAGKYPERRVIGYEMSYVPYIFSLALRKILGRKNIFLYHRDYLEADLSGAVLLVCYLSPDSMHLLREKLEEDEAGEVTIISNTFALPLCQPAGVVRLNNIYRTPLYIYRFPDQPTATECRTKDLNSAIYFERMRKNQTHIQALNGDNNE